VLIYGIGMSLMVQLVVWLFQSGYTGVSFRKNVAVMMIVSLVIIACHLFQVAVWAIVFFLLGEFSRFEPAFFCSAGNYSSLGSGSAGLSEQWRLLGPLETINGLLVFGLSTALLFALMSRLIANRLHLHSKEPGEER
jgi:hypothetical protein